MLENVNQILTDISMRGMQPEDHRALEGAFVSAASTIRNLQSQLQRTQTALKVAASTAQEESARAQMLQMDNEKLRKTNKALMDAYAELFQVTDAHITAEIMRKVKKTV